MPWALEHDGPLVMASTKPDVLAQTIAHRRTLGRVWVYAPFTPSCWEGADSAGWSPLEQCSSWEGALTTAGYLHDAASGGERSGEGDWWDAQGARLLAPLLRAAALSKGSMGEVLAWLDEQSEAPVALLEEAVEQEAARRLAGILALDERPRSSTFLSARSLLAAYEYPAVQATDHADFSADSLLEGPHTLYLVAGEDHQRLLAPVFVALVNSIFRAAGERSAAVGGAPLDPCLRVLIDETANVAPMRSLPQRMSVCGGHGVRVATVWQSRAQMVERYKQAADAISGNSGVELFLGPLTDEATRKHVTALLGRHDERVSSTTSRGLMARESTTRSEQQRDVASAQELQQLRRGRALVVHGRDLPMVVEVEPYYRRADLRPLLSA